MADRQLPIPEVIIPDHRLGRHINHDPQSLAYKVTPRGTPTSVKWARHVGPFDQGNLGSCTIQSLLGVLASDPFWSTLPKDLQTALGRSDIQTSLAQPLYREETRLDPFKGAWEPDDTGSDGLSAAKTGKNHGWINGYLHITSLDAAWTGIKDGPFITGVMWMSGMDYPDSEGIVHATGSVRGGHEFEVAEYDASRGLWGCWNSWTASWGKGGKFYIPDEDYQTLLKMQGDATTFVPVTAPAPTPDPTPTPTPTAFPFAQVDPWANARKPWWTKRDRVAADAYINWRKTAK
jgi:hypothetical protein